MYQIAICDDEPKICSMYQTKVQSLLEKHSIEAGIDTYSRPLEFWEAIQQREYQLVFLDIDMPQLDGFRLAEQMGTLRQKPLLVFVTNQDALVYQTFQYHPFSFIRKSFLEEELEQVLLSALEELAGRQRRYTFRQDKQLISVLLNDVLYFEAEGNYLLIHTKNGQYRFRETLSNAQQELGDKGFVRIHKGFLVNEEAVYRIGGEEIILCDQTKLPLGRANRERAKEQLMQYLMS